MVTKYYRVKAQVWARLLTYKGRKDLFTIIYTDAVIDRKKRKSRFGKFTGKHLPRIAVF